MLFAALFVVAGDAGHQYMFSMATNYGKDVVELFGHSARSSGYDGEIWIAVFKRQTRALTNAVTRYNIKLVEIAEGAAEPVMMMNRFRFYRDWCTLLEPHDWVLTFDLRDSVVQVNPFDDRFAATFLQPINLFNEPSDWPIERCQWNRGWIEACWGKVALAAVAKKKIICSGNIFARVDYMRYLLTEMIDLSRTVPHCWDLRGFDQGVLNFLAHINHWESNTTSVRIWTQGTGAVNTIGYLDKVNADKNGFVLNSDGSLSGLVHQYDRHAFLKIHVNRRHRRL